MRCGFPVVHFEVLGFGVWVLDKGMKVAGFQHLVLGFMIFGFWGLGFWLFTFHSPLGYA